VHTRPPYLRGFNADAPRELVRIVEQALAKRPEERFGTAERFAQALFPYAEGALPTVPARRDPARSGPIPAHDTRPSSSRHAGLGEEGLDALFPEEQAPGQGAPPRRAKQTIPLPSFRLPAKPTRPLVAETGVDLEALLARMEAQLAGSGQGETGHATRAAQVPSAAPSAADTPPPAAETPLAALEEEEHALPVWLRPTAAPLSHPSAAETSAAALDAGAADVDATLWDEHGSATASSSDDRPARSTAWLERPPRWGGRPLWTGAAIAAVLLLALAIGVAFNGSALGLVLGPRPTETRATPTITVAPSTTPSLTATATPSTPPTATPNPQRALNQQAAASFRAIVLGLSQDRSCSGANAITHFATRATVYVNLCTSTQALGVPTTVTIQQQGRVVNILTTGFFMRSSASYYFYRVSMPAGTYHMVVTQRIDGGDGVAASIPFTVG
jgi:hypothetical protein